MLVMFLCSSFMFSFSVLVLGLTLLFGITVFFLYRVIASALNATNNNDSASHIPPARDRIFLLVSFDGFRHSYLGVCNSLWVTAVMCLSANEAEGRDIGNDEQKLCTELALSSLSVWFYRFFYPTVLHLKISPLYILLASSHFPIVVRNLDLVSPCSLILLVTWLEMSILSSKIQTSPEVWKFFLPSYHSILVFCPLLFFSISPILHFYPLFSPRLVFHVFNSYRVFLPKPFPIIIRLRLACIQLIMGS